jgi:transcriptional regulator with XRE-family HTH domain
MCKLRNMGQLDHRALASELLHSLRGKRSQAGFARRLGYRSNVASRWESGHCFPTALETLRAMQRLGIDVRKRLQLFFRMQRPWLESVNPCTKTGITALLADLRGATPIAQIAEQTGHTRFQVSRWLRGISEPRLPAFLELVDVLSLRLPDFLSVFVDPEQLPTLKSTWQQLSAAREAAFARPWSHAVLRALELSSTRSLARHAPGFLAESLRISLEEEQSCLKLLERAGQVRKHRGRWLLAESMAVDLRSEPERVRALKAFWLEAARERLLNGAEGAFAFNVFSISESDLAELRELHLAFYQQLQRRIAASAPNECVALYSAQLLRFDA